jgi:hypothetical protein
MTTKTDTELIELNAHIFCYSQATNLASKVSDPAIVLQAKRFSCDSFLGQPMIGIDSLVLPGQQTRALCLRC